MWNIIKGWKNLGTPNAMTFKLFLFGILVAEMSGCVAESPNTDKVGEDILATHETTLPPINAVSGYSDTIYVPIYSDIYVNANNPDNLLAATLSIRNTSIRDSLYVSLINYYDTEGRLVRSYLSNPIVLGPMASIDYVIEREDQSGGSGANFLLALSGGNKKMRPIIQAVMIGSDGNKGIGFTTDGYSISKE
jgi:hypothetical protein